MVGRLPNWGASHRAALGGEEVAGVSWEAGELDVVLGAEDAVAAVVGQREELAVDRDLGGVRGHRGDLRVQVRLRADRRGDLVIADGSRKVQPRVEPRVRWQLG